MSGHTPGPWIVVERRVPFSLRDGHSSFHVERRVFTAAIHPQLRGHYPIVTGSTAIGEKPGSPAVHLVSIGEDDARLIAAAPTQHEELVRFLPIIERAEADPELWARLTEGTGIATANAYRAAIQKATRP